MSQVHIQNSNETICGISRYNEIVKVKLQKKLVLHREVKFSKNTHFKKSTETTYQEFVDLYLVLEVLKSKSIKVGQNIKVLKMPAYGLEDMKRYHETGESESPALLAYKTKHKVEPGEPFFLFLQPTKELELFIFSAEEGLKSETEIKIAIARKD